MGTAESLEERPNVGFVVVGLVLAQLRGEVVRGQGIA